MPEVDIEGRRLSLSNLEKVLYPEAGFTKGQVIDYYTRVAPMILPHLRDRPLTLLRYPNGVDSKFFYEKQCPKHRPDWVETAEVQSSSKVINYCLANDLATLVWLSNLASLEIHPLLAFKEDVTRPTKVTFDLDPGPPAGIVECCRVALELRDLFSHFDLECFPKTSGSKGMQIEIPLNRNEVTYDQTKPFAHAVAQLMERQAPARVTSVMEKALRPGKVFIDWSQNHETKTTVCVYSLRAKTPWPTASTPLSWDEVAEGAASKKKDGVLRFLSDDVLRRIDEHGDLFAPVASLEQRLPLNAPGT
jgi:bifunctional non-homologous end joining protein LigD